MNLKCLLKQFAVLLVTFNIAASALGMGTESGGGGDPDAVDFLRKVITIGEWALRSHAGLTSTDVQVINTNAKKLSNLMDDPAVTPISMVEQDLTDESGASKVALFDLAAFKIRVTRAKWKALSDEDKFLVAALELFGLSEVQNRYAVAGLVQQDIQQIKQISEIINQNWSYRSAIKVGDVVTYEEPGIYKSSQEVYPMAVSLKDVDYDFDSHVMGLKIATQ